MAHYIIFGDSIGCGEGDPNGGWANLVKLFSEAMKAIADQEKLKFVDLFNQLPAEYIQTFDDGLHPNHAGHEMIVKIIYQNL